MKFSCLVIWLLMLMVGTVVGAVPSVEVVAVQDALEDGAGSGKFLLQTTDTSHSGIYVNAVLGGTAVAGRDYYIKPAGDFTIPPGKRGQVINIIALNNSSVDGERTITLTLRDPRLLTGLYKPGSRNTAQIVIVDDDGIPPDAPTNPVAAGDTPSAGTIRITWTDGANTDLIYIERSTDQIEWADINTVGIAAGTQTYDDTMPATGVTYYYRIRGENNFGPGDYSSVVNAVASVQAPVAATGLVATVTSPTTVDLTWTKSVSAVTEQRPRIDGADVGVSLPPLVNLWQATNLIANTAYSFVIRSTNSAGFADTAGVPATTWRDSLTVPGSFVSTDISVSQITNSWTLTVTTNDNVLFEYSTAANYSGATRVTLAGNTTGYLLGSLAADTKYYTRVATTNKTLVLQSPWATSSATTQPQAPAAPTLTLNADDQDALVAAWTDSAARDYELQHWRTGGLTTNTISAITNLTYRLTGLNVAVDYSARVRGRNSVGIFGNWSGVANGSTAGAVGLSGTANGLTVSLLSDTVAGATNYVFQRRNLANAQWVQIASQASTSYTDSDYGTRLYVLVHDPPTSWTSKVLAAGSGKVGWVLLNDNSGPAAFDAAYQTYVTAVHAAGMKTLGYVSTLWGARALSAVYADIDLWMDNYDLSGIFVDEVGFQRDNGSPVDMSTFANLQDSLDYYTAIRDRILTHGSTKVMSGNMGQRPITLAASNYASIASHNPVNIFEDAMSHFLNQTQPAHFNNHPPSRFVALIDGVDDSLKDTFDHAKKVLNIGGIYVRPWPSAGWGDEPTTWDEQLACITKFPANHTVYYRVKAEFNDGTAETMWSDAVAVTTGSDTPSSPPVVTLTSPANGSTVAQGSTVAFAATATDADGISSVQFLVNSVVVVTDLNAPYTHNWVATPGTITIEARATDALGNTATSSPVSITVTPTVSNSPPVVTITSSVSTTTAGDLVTFSVTATDADGFIQQVDFYNPGFMSTDTAPNASGEWCLEWSNVPAGTFTVTAVATDDDGAQDSDSVSITVNPVTPPPPPPPGPTTDWWISASGGFGLSTAGTQSDPFHFDYASASGGRANGRVRPGHVLTLTPGDHDLGTSAWIPGTIGTSSQKMIYQAPGWGQAWVNNNGGADILRTGSNNIFRDIRFFCRNPDNFTALSKANSRTDMPRRDVVFEGTGSALVHCIVHDTRNGIGHFQSVGGRLYGTLIYNTGYVGSQRGSSYVGWGQNAYFQNNGPPAAVVELCMMMGSTDQYAFQFQGTSASFVKHLTFKANFVQQNEALFGFTQTVENVTLDGNMFFDSRMRFNLQSGHTSSNTLIEDNYTWYKRLHRNLSAAKYRSLGDLRDFDTAGDIVRGDFTLNRNTYIRDTTIYPGDTGNITTAQDLLKVVGVNDGDITGVDNVFIGPNRFGGDISSFSQLQALLDSSSNTHTTTIPTVNKIFVKPSAEAQKRAHVVIFNFENVTSDEVDLSSVLSPNDVYQVFWPWDIQNGVDPNNTIVAPQPIQAGTYVGGNVTLNWAGMPNEGQNMIQHTGFEAPFERDSRIAAFIILGQ